MMTKSDFEVTENDFSELEGMNPKQIKEHAIDDLNIDPDYLESEVERDSIFSKDTADEMANLEYFAEKYENTLLGRTREKKGNNEIVYKQTGKALAGSTFIKQTTSLIKTFANTSMLLSSKEDKVFYMQFEDVFRKCSNMLLERKHNINVINARAILKEIKDTFWNLGGILTATGGNMDKYFGIINRNVDEVGRSLNNSGIGDR